MATKAEIYTSVVEQVKELLDSYPKMSKEFKSNLWAILEQNLAPKNSGSSVNPPKEIDGVMHYYCRFHQRYEPEANMVMSKSKSKGYCKASISLWNKANNEIKKLDREAVEAMSEGDFDKAQAIAKKSKELKDKFNKPEFYDFERDWAEFNKK